MHEPAQCPTATRVLRYQGNELSDVLARHLGGDLGDTAVTGSVELATLWSDSASVHSAFALGSDRITVDSDLIHGVTTVAAPAREPEHAPSV